MSYESLSYSCADIGLLKKKMLQWVSHRNIFLFLDNNNYDHTSGRYECLCGRGATAIYGAEDIVASEAVLPNTWLMGHVAYDFKNRLERLNSRHPEAYNFGLLRFFVPEAIAFIPRNNPTLQILSPDPEQTLREILSEEIADSKPLPQLEWQTALSKEHYLQTVETLRDHIREGDCYEINLCNEAVAKQPVQIDPVSVFNALNEVAPNPFSAFYKTGEDYAICASPERFIFRNGARIIAQPIKGTIRRGSSEQEDAALRRQLTDSIKDRAENVMITDLMRNDLARLCQTGSVQVDELFGLYAFPRVHQMISTISGQLRPDTTFSEILKKTFPMGSMTGAPKIKVMELIDRYEQSRRELFSGALGYIEPGGNFDFNVMIRSLFYNSSTQRLSYQTGGAITYDSNALQEWEETRLKASAIEQLFQSKKGPQA